MGRRGKSGRRRIGTSSQGRLSIVDQSKKTKVVVGAARGDKVGNVQREAFKRAVFNETRR